MSKTRSKTLGEACSYINNNFKHILEFGVAKGRSVSFLRNNFGKDYKIFGFDTFTGLPEDWISESGQMIGPKNTFSMEGKPPNIPGVVFYKGLFKDTIPQYIKLAEPIALLHVDCDLYNSTIDVLYGLNDFIFKDTVIVFDEWIYLRDPKYNDHEQKAFNEWIKDKKRSFETIITSESNNPNTEQYAIKITK